MTKQLLDNVFQFCQIDSTTGSENSVLLYLEAYFQKLGYCVERFAVSEGRFNLLASSKGASQVKLA